MQTTAESWFDRFHSSLFCEAVTCAAGISEWREGSVHLMSTDVSFNSHPPAKLQPTFSSLVQMHCGMERAPSETQNTSRSQVNISAQRFRTWAVQADTCPWRGVTRALLFGGRTVRNRGSNTNPPLATDGLGDSVVVLSCSNHQGFAFVD
ncbi:hypothetical protein BJY00DRAFT_180160 [Aspergillus carlsbadensis]|nr:hypothetical protein BJY00DRAFT_180160 [Aspergillus carlsbadensis]